MSRRGKRKRIGKYIYEDLSGISAFVYHRGRLIELPRFELGTDLAVIRRAQDAELGKLLTAPPPQPSAGTVAAVLAKYTPGGDKLTQAEMDVRSHHKAWIAACGAEDFLTLKKGRLNAIVKGWREAEYAEGTIAKRITALRNVARAIADERDDENAPLHASERIDRPTEDLTGAILGRDMTLVERVLDNVCDWNQARGEPSKTRAILEVWTWTGHYPSTLKRIEPSDVTWGREPTLVLKPRRKGKGVPGKPVALMPQAVPALRRFFERDCHVKGAYKWNTGVLLRTFKRARNKTQLELLAEGRKDDAARLDGMTPKDLRHSIATKLLADSGDLYGVSEFLQHANPMTTKRYVTGASTVRTRAVVDAYTQRCQKKSAVGAKKSAKNTRRFQPQKAKGGQFLPQTATAPNRVLRMTLRGKSMTAGRREVSPKSA